MDAEEDRLLHQADFPHVANIWTAWKAAAA